MNWLRHIILLTGVCFIFTQDPPPEFQFTQGTQQAFYLFESVTIGGVAIDADDWVGAFNGDICVGARKWDISQCNSGVCDVPVMGYDGSDTAGYMTPGGIPTFKIYDASADDYFDASTYNTSGESQDVAPFYNFQINNYSADLDPPFNLYLSGIVVEGCTNSTACNYNADATWNDGSCLNNDCAGECGGSAIPDVCGVCSYGTTTHTPNLDQDCAGVCFGTSQYDECGRCNGSGKYTCWDNSSMECDIGNCPDKSPPDTFQFHQSTQQTFYFFDSVTIDGVAADANDWVGAFNGNVCVGARQLGTSCSSGDCFVPVMGVDIMISETAGYMMYGDIPTFKIYDASAAIYLDAEAAQHIAWVSNTNPIINSLVDTASLSIDDLSIPNTYSISNIYPNPFNPVTSIEYSLPENTIIELSVYNMNGRQIQTLVQGFQISGNHSIHWNASNYPSGVYLIKLESSTFSKTEKAVLIK